MATYFKQTGIRYLSQLKTALTGASDKITVDDSGSSMIINIWDKTVLTFTDKSQTDLAYFTLIIDDETISSSGNGLRLYHKNVSVEIIESDAFLSVKIGPDISGTFLGNSIYITEFKEDENIYVGGYVWENTTVISTYFDTKTIYNIPFKKIGDTTETSLTIARLFSYAAYPSTVDYSNLSVIVSSVGRVATTTLFKSCSTVTYLSTISLGSKNYLAIGTNTIIEIEPLAL